ncbi:hypothetical protein KSC_046060 [Ktedonobacter sp. SOSP1-52]|uniref:hypothetical protein n=1 Tax=Ktedonobacter sp. SOSP1-52 TaxID=2778366 RepID=UPI001915A072|nr:hypothetical protein [Ktedonobacter sp. SOSP1-52]GHO65714.1 hypothetical protein KSC_046060 [Ktedonobacter sp. SOSP1-52]
MTGLSTVRAINQATQQSAMGKRGYVKCQEQDGTVSRVIRARSVQNQLQVKRLHDGRWVIPVTVWWADQ